jgi:hypothetical protein
MPRNFLSQNKENNPEVRSSMGAKLTKAFARRYLLYRIITSLTSFFAVWKGDTEIRMVYNGASSGMNARLWVPWFALPTICALLRALELSTCMAESYIVEMLLNFML